MIRNLTILLVILISFFLTGCPQPVQSVSGTQMTTAGKVQVGSSGKTVEQENIARRIQQDNALGSIQHLYIISPYSGQVLIYSTVKGKVTSGGKRLTPNRVDGSNQFSFTIGQTTHNTVQVLGEDGTYGESSNYIYWWDSKDVYHQHLVTDGQIIHISNQPVVVKSVVINMETTEK